MVLILFVECLIDACSNACSSCAKSSCYAEVVVVWQTRSMEHHNKTVMLLCQEEEEREATYLSPLQETEAQKSQSSSSGMNSH